MRISAFCTHNGSPEMLLLRVGHHLWRERKRTIAHGTLCALDAALLSVWRAKAEWRAQHTRDTMRDAQKGRRKCAITK